MITEIKMTARRLDLLNQLNLTSIDQLVNYYPKKYEDLTCVKLNKDLVLCLNLIDEE